MRVLFTTHPAEGHFHPQVPLARALRAAGHEVAFACSPSYRPTIEAVGFHCFPAGLAWLEPDMDQAFPALRQIPHGPEWEAWVVDHILAGATAEALARDVLELAREWQPHVIVRDGVEFGGCLAAEVRGIPHAIGGFAPFGPPGMYRDVFARPLAALRETFGLPPDPDVRMPHRYLGLVPTVPGFLSWQEVPPTVHFLRPLPFDRSGGERLPDWALDLPERPTVYATLGTIVNRSPGVFAAILEGLCDEPITLILTIGRNQDPADFGPQPSNVHIERYVPQTLLLPYCDLVVTHGGFNTVQAALGHGLPLVLLPIAADQHLNAHACANLGVGRVIGSEERTPGAIRAAVREALATQTYRASAERVRDEMAAMPRAEYAVALLERLAADKQPLLTVALGA
jgi:UDP:flavonoid glycosyltransferase YjiC (YdhE family)